jgi:hypothetical protein
MRGYAYEETGSSSSWSRPELQPMALPSSTVGEKTPWRKADPIWISM